MPAPPETSIALSTIRQHASTAWYFAEMSLAGQAAPCLKLAMTITFITGANKGLGYETTRRLKGLGHTVLLGLVIPGGDHSLRSFPQHMEAIVRFAGLG